MEKELDNIDKNIIRILQENARTPVKDIAKEVFLSSPAVSARIERLEKRGILAGYHATVNPMLFGYHIKAFINLEVEPAQKKEFYPFIDRIPNVIECNCVTGDYAMLVEVMFQTTIQLDHFINELQQFRTNQNTNCILYFCGAPRCARELMNFAIPSTPIVR